MASFTSKRADDPRDNTALEDDVTTISYEQALRSHRRIPSPEPATESLPIKPEAVPLQPADSSSQQPGDEKKRKAASITLRLTASEQSQLRDRAAAAQLSVSAYIRSCIFEAESLRTQVKEALAQMQTSCQIAPAATPRKPPRNWHNRLFATWSRSQSAKTES